jgi:hypothetical protein
MDRSIKCGESPPPARRSAFIRSVAAGNLIEFRKLLVNEGPPGIRGNGGEFLEFWFSAWGDARRETEQEKGGKDEESHGVASNEINWATIMAELVLDYAKTQSFSG